MDKILAFSILSSSPADIAAGGGYCSATRLSWRTAVSGCNQKQAPKQDKSDQQQQKQEQTSLPVPERKPETRPRFAPEFDGLNCFESIVSF